MISRLLPDERVSGYRIMTFGPDEIKAVMRRLAGAKGLQRPLIESVSF
jgi:hypothetical protein